MMTCMRHGYKIIATDNRKELERVCNAYRAKVIRKVGKIQAYYVDVSQAYHEDCHESPIESILYQLDLDQKSRQIRIDNEKTKRVKDVAPKMYERLDRIRELARIWLAKEDTKDNALSFAYLTTCIDLVNDALSDVEAGA